MILTRFTAKALLLSLMLAGLALFGSAQQPESAHQPAAQKQNTLPVISFKLQQHRSELSPAVYEIRLTPDGAATYHATTAGDDPYDIDREFLVTPSTTARIFELAKASNYFDGDFDFHGHTVADTGAKTLSYIPVGEAAPHSTTYNWSQDKAIDELNRIFLGIAATIDTEERLKHLRRFDPLGLNAEMASLEQRASMGSLREVQIMAGTLRQIADDAHLMQVVRQRARRLLQTYDAGN